MPSAIDAAPSPRRGARFSSPDTTWGQTNAATLSIRPAAHHDPASRGPPSSSTVCTSRAANRRPTASGTSPPAPFAWATAVSTPQVSTSARRASATSGPQTTSTGPSAAVCTRAAGLGDGTAPGLSPRATAAARSPRRARSDEDRRLLRVPAPTITASDQALQRCTNSRLSDLRSSASRPCPSPPDRPRSSRTCR